MKIPTHVYWPGLHWLIEGVKIGLLILLCISCLKLISIGDTLINEKTLRVTEVKHIANIEHFYGDLPVIAGEKDVIVEREFWERLDEDTP